MPESLDLNRVLIDCERYWRETGVPTRALVEMKLELSQHLNEPKAERSKPSLAETWPTSPRHGHRSTGIGSRPRRGRTSLQEGPPRVEPTEGNWWRHHLQA